MRHPPRSPTGPTPHGVHSKRSKHAIREGNRSKRKQGGNRNRGSRPSYDVRRILDASPPPKHCLSEPAPHRMRYSHTDKRSEARHSPRRVVEERDGHAAASTLAQVGEEARRLRPKGSVRRDGQRDEAHAGGEHSVLGANAV
jgi:hypothetical protein